MDELDESLEEEQQPPPRKRKRSTWPMLVVFVIVALTGFQMHRRFTTPLGKLLAWPRPACGTPW
jgi:hypothetical protein